MCDSSCICKAQTRIKPVDRSYIIVVEPTECMVNTLAQCLPRQKQHLRIQQNQTQLTGSHDYCENSIIIHIRDNCNLD
jgi:hypothetical protein